MELKPKSLKDMLSWTCFMIWWNSRVCNLRILSHWDMILKKNEHLAVCAFFLPPVPMTVSLMTRLNMTGPNSQNFLESIILWMSSVVLTLELVIKCALRYVTVNLDFCILNSIFVAPVWWPLQIHWCKNMNQWFVFAMFLHAIAKCSIYTILFNPSDRLEGSWYTFILQMKKPRLTEIMQLA